MNLEVKKLGDYLDISTELYKSEDMRNMALIFMPAEVAIISNALGYSRIASRSMEPGSSKSMTRIAWTFTRPML